MGMYTALVLDARLKDNVPKHVLETLEYMISANKPVEEGYVFPNHPLFGDTRWSRMLRGSSAYFPVEREPKLEFPFFGKSDRTYMLSVGFSIKNYDNEISLFLDWLKPYTEEAIGWTMYEEDENPTLILWPFTYDEEE